MYRLAIVDDNESWCFVLAVQLQQQGYLVSTFTDSTAFLREADQFDLALVDFSMPPRRYQTETDGPEVINKVKQRFDHPPLLILISSYFSEDILEQVMDVYPDADAVISKQVDSQDLLHQIKQLLATRKPSRQVRPQVNYSQASMQTEARSWHR